MLILAAGAGLIALSVMLLVIALRMRERPKTTTGVDGGLAAIESVYAVDRPGSAATVRSGRGRLLRLGRALAGRLTPGGTMELLQRRLDIAGNPGLWTPDRVLSFKGLGLLLLAATGTLLGLPAGPGPAVLYTVIGALAGFFLPDLLLYNAGLRRQDELRRSLPDVLDLLVVSVEAGLGFDAALSRVARNVKGPLAGEFARLLQEMQIGSSREAALQAMAERTSVEELRSFVSALVQASDLGIPIGNVLRAQAKEMRVKRRQLAEEQAQKVPVKITLPVIGCILPALFIVVLGPGIIGILNSGLFH
jgi:tight adherence protein C